MRQKPRLRVYSGLVNPMDSSSRKRSAPVAANQSFWSGAIISLNNNGQWVLGGQANKIPFVACSDSNAPDVVDSGKLEGIYCSDPIEIHTSYFKTGDTYTEDTPLTWDGSTGNFKATTLESGEPIIGFAQGAPFSVKSSVTSSVGGPGEVDTVDTQVLRIRLAYLPNTVDNT
jgi:hypothetical protein